MDERRNKEKRIKSAIAAVGLCAVFVCILLFLIRVLPYSKMFMILLQDANFQLAQPQERVVCVELGTLESGEALPVFHPEYTLPETENAAFLTKAETVEYNFTLPGDHSVQTCTPEETVVKITFADGAYHYLHTGGSAYVSAEGKMKERREATWHNGYDALIEEYMEAIPSKDDFQQEE